MRVGPVFVEVDRAIDACADVDLLEIEIDAVFVVEQGAFPVERQSLFVVIGAKDAAFL